jgi:hypothetical protein
MKRNPYWLIGLLPLLLGGCGEQQPPPDAAAPPVPAEPVGRMKVLEPSTLDDTGWLEQRAEAQRNAARDWGLVHQFGLRDRIGSSGIDFKHRITDDSGKAYRAVHYDHGSGVAAADVDGDGLSDLYFVNQLGANGLWRNLGAGPDGPRFEDVTQGAGVGLGDRVGVGASFADIDNDGDADLYVTSVRGGNVLFENLGDGRFRDISAASGLAYVGHSSAAQFFDYDRDGLLDLLLVNVGRYTTEEKGGGGYFVGFKDAFGGHLKPERDESSRIYRNLGKGRFEDVTEALGFNDKRWSGDATVLDVNRDGWPDIYMLNMQGLDGYWENRLGKGFVERSDEVFPNSSWGAMGIKPLDADGDGELDLLITDMHSDMSYNLPPDGPEKSKSVVTYPPSYLIDDYRGIYGNSLFLRRGGAYREASDAFGVENYWPWGLSVGDLNADGWQDVFITAGMNYPYRYAVNSLLLNQNGKSFVDAEFVLGAEPRLDGQSSTHWFDLDCIGVDRSHELCRKYPQAAELEVWGAMASRSSVILDLEGDGDLDIVTNEFGAAPMLLISDLAQRRPSLNWLAVRLQGRASNRDGVGAEVRLRVGGRTLLQVQDGVSGYLSKSRLPLYFGLGDAKQIDGIEILWPSGRRQSLQGPIEGNQVLHLAEPEAG